MRISCLSNCVNERDSAQLQVADATQTQSSPNFALREYRRSVGSNSYNEVWSTIQSEEGNITINNRESVDQALRRSRPSRLVSCYLEQSEATTNLCLSLHRSLRRARSLYAPLHALLDLFSGADDSLSRSQCDFAVQVFLQFDSLDNPFPPPDSLTLDHICTSFARLKLQLDRRLRRSHSALRRRLLLLTAAAAASLSCAPPRGREVARARMQQLDAAKMGAFVLDVDLRTINCLAVLLHDAVQQDKESVRVGLEGGPDRHLIQEVIKLLRKNYATFVHQLQDIEERICLCLNTVNRATTLLLHHIHRHQTLVLGEAREETVSNSGRDLVTSPVLDNNEAFR